MAQNIFVGILCAVALFIGVWGWWVDNGSSFRRSAEKKNETNAASEETGNSLNSEQK